MSSLSERHCANEAVWLQVRQAHEGLLSFGWCGERHRELQDFREENRVRILANGRRMCGRAAAEQHEPGSSTHATSGRRLRREKVTERNLSFSLNRDRNNMLCTMRVQPRSTGAQPIDHLTQSKPGTTPTSMGSTRSSTQSAPRWPTPPARY